MLDFAIIIPSRFESSRFRGKPLALINGVEMIIRTVLQCKKVSDEVPVYVTTDDQRIVECCKKHNIDVLITPPSCKTGTDRVYLAAKEINIQTVINVQGDEPLIDPDDIIKVMSLALHCPRAVINGYADINNESDYFNVNIPKVIIDKNERLVYASRAAIPANKKQTLVKARKQICIYAYPKSALRSFYEWGKKTPLELIEDIEILRFLELGFQVKMVKLSGTSIAVDIPEDIAKVERYLQENANLGDSGWNFD